MKYPATNSCYPETYVCWKLMPILTIGQPQLLFNL